MSKSIRNARSQFLITWPHCDVPKDVALDLLKDHWEAIYIVVAHERHADGASHLHAYVKLVESHSIPRKKMHYIYDIVKQWQLSDEGSVEPDNISYRWAKQWFDEEDLEQSADYIPKAGEDVKDVIINSIWWRRWHPNIEPVRSPKDALKYVKKHGDIISWGICPCKETLTKKEKNALLLTTNLTKLVDDGEIGLLALPQLKKALDVYKNELSSCSNEKKTVKWFYGETGTGKTRTAFEEATAHAEGDISKVWISHTTDQWYDGYCGQPCVILDDIRAATWKFAELLRILDRYPIDVPVKGGFRRWTPTHIWITAPTRPRELYRNYQTGEPYDGIEQLERRITEQREFNGGRDSEDAGGQGEPAITQWD